MAIEGILLVDKPSGPTSAQVVRQVIRLSGLKQCGHLGTLDPMATGLLVILLGNALKLVPYYLKGTKRYLADIAFGRSTDTFDADGATVESADIPPDLAQRVSAGLPGFLGTRVQVPPVFSAIKVRGERLHRLARRGEEVEAPARTVTFDKLELLSVEGAVVRVDVTCSSGTYVRSLAQDLGTAVGCPAHLAGLRRTESRPFTLDRAVRPEDLPEWPAAFARFVRPVEETPPDLPRVVLSPEEEIAVRHGRALADTSAVAGRGSTGHVLLWSSAGRIVAVGEASQDAIRVKRVIDT